MLQGGSSDLYKKEQIAVSRLEEAASVPKTDNGPAPRADYGAGWIAEQSDASAAGWRQGTVRSSSNGLRRGRETFTR
jgi:hypothetical protein